MTRRGLSQNEREIASMKFLEARRGGERALSVRAADAGRWGVLVMEAHDAIAEPARALVAEAAEWPADTQYVVVSRELCDALAAALDV